MTGHDVLVAGGGPAGRALAGACARLGLRTALLDPAPDRPWHATYAAWADELPSLPDTAVASRSRGTAVALTRHDLGWDYAVLDTAGLRAHLDAGLAGVAVLRGSLPRDAPPARVVVAATGHRASGRVAAAQTAFGVVVDEAVATPLVAPGEALFMDWRPDHRRPGWPTFLYAVPLGGGRVLLEETSLARRPGLPLPELRERLVARLAHHGIAVPRDAPSERVRFPVDEPRDRRTGSGSRAHRGSRCPSDDHVAVAFGAAAPLVHPATGFSVAAALALAPRVAQALASADPAHARRAVWPPDARAVHRLRRIGLEALLRMPPAEVPEFFEVFLGLPAHHRWAYLTGRADLAGTVGAMGALYRRAGWRLRGRLVGPALLPRSAPVTTG